MKVKTKMTIIAILAILLTILLVGVFACGCVNVYIVKQPTAYIHSDYGYYRPGFRIWGPISRKHKQHHHHHSRRCD